MAFPFQRIQEMSLNFFQSKCKVINSGRTANYSVPGTEKCSFPKNSKKSDYIKAAANKKR